MVDKLDSYLTLGFTAALVVGVGAVGVASLVQPTVEKTVSDVLAAEIARAGGTFDGIDYDQTKDEVTIAGLNFDPAATGGDGVYIQSLQLVGADIIGMRKAFVGFVGVAEDEPASEFLFDELVVTNLTIKSASDDGALTVGSLEFENVSLVPLSAEALEDDEMLVLELLAKLRFDEYIIEDVSYVDPASQTNGSIDLHAVMDYDRGDTGAQTIRDLAADSTELSVTVKSIDLANLKAAGALAQLIQSDNIGEEFIASFANIPVGDMSISDVQLTSKELGAGISIERYSVVDATYDGDVPTSGKTELEGFRLSPELVAVFVEDPAWSEIIDDGVTINSVSDFSFNPDTGELRIPEIRVEAEGLGAVSASAELGEAFLFNELVKLNGTMVEDIDLDAIFDTALSTQIISLSWTYEDASLTTKLFDAMAQVQGTTRDEVRAQAIQIVQDEFAGFPAHSFRDDLRDALVMFLEEPGAIRISANPEEPVPLALLSLGGLAPEAIGDALGLSVEVSK